MKFFEVFNSWIIEINFFYLRYICNLKTAEDDSEVDRWLEWESVQLQVSVT